MRSLFICPVCAAALQREERRYICPAGHSFDPGPRKGTATCCR